MTSLPLVEIFARNPLRPPYFAFADVSLTGEADLVGRFTPEQTMGEEVGEIAAAEAGRHLAILGSVAAARLLEGTHYLLATQAHLRRLAPMVHASSRVEGKLVATARVEEVTRRGVTARTALFNGQKLFELDVSYQVLPARLFERLFASHGIQADNEAETLTESPYRQSPLLQERAANENAFTATCGPLPPSLCAGHFPGYPTWPVALVMHCLSRLAGLHLEHLHSKPIRYWVKDAVVQAENLAFCGDKLALRSEHLMMGDGDAYFRCSARTADKLIGQMVVTLIGARASE